MRQISEDADLENLFDDAIKYLQELGHSFSTALSLARDYHDKFTDPKFCKRIGIPVQENDFFHHDGARELALKAHYYLFLKLDPKPERYIDWRRNFYKDRSANQKATLTSMPPLIDWDEQGTLDHTVGGYKIRTDPLWVLVTTAMQGHEGDVADMTITMASGITYGPREIHALAVRRDRKRG